MNRITRTLATVATTAVACVGVILVGAPAQAAPNHRVTIHAGTARVTTESGGRGSKPCRDIGYSNYYVHHWQDIPIWKILNSPYVFREHVCHRNGFRLFVSRANTKGEVKFQRHFLKTDRPKKPTMFCKLSPSRSYFIDLDFYWSDREPSLNRAERNHYTHWAHLYAHRHGCRLFLPKS